MPSWNIHTAHVERLLEGRDVARLGIDDTNAFLFGNYAPDVYLGFMVPDITYRIDYCLTHLASLAVVPVPDADRFWDIYVFKRRPSGSGAVSLTLGAWAHLVADRMYNGRFRAFCETHDTPTGEELRLRKQADFDVFGKSLGISLRVQVTDELLEAAKSFYPYSMLSADVKRAVAVADKIVRTCVPDSAEEHYQLLSAEWLADVFDACDDELARWLLAWHELEQAGLPASASDIRARAGLPAASYGL